MDLVGEHTIPAPRSEVWRALNDPEVLQRCLTGCDSLEKVSDTEFDGRLTFKVGAIKAKLKGKVELSDVDAPNSYKISGQGQGSVAGFAKGGAHVNLSDSDNGGTLLVYNAEAQLGGKLAAVGSRVIEGIAKKMTDDFFEKFAAHFVDEHIEEPLSVISTDAGLSVAKKAAPGLSAIVSGAVAPDLAARGLEGTLRDLLWLLVGVAFGAAFTWALMT